MSEVYEDIHVSATACGKVVSVQIWRNTTGTALSLHTANRIATLPVGSRPARDWVEVCAGTGTGGEWLMLYVSTSGEVGLYHLYGAESYEWSRFHVHLCFVAA